MRFISVSKRLIVLTAVMHAAQYNTDYGKALQRPFIMIFVTEMK